jgi:hypothetical protein
MSTACARQKPRNGNSLTAHRISVAREQDGAGGYVEEDRGSSFV